MPFFVITLMTEKACCQIKDIVNKESNNEMALLKDNLIQAVIISLCSLLLQSYHDLPLGYLRLHSITFKSS